VERLCFPELARYFLILELAKEFPNDLLHPLGLEAMRDAVSKCVESFRGAQDITVSQASGNKRT